MVFKQTFSFGQELFTRFERVLAVLLILIPAVLFVGDSRMGRGSISAYFSMEENQLFYMPLTVAAMLFAVNGIIRKQHWYNIFLGVTLAGLLLFNQRDFKEIHTLFATAFFVGNAIVIFLSETPKKYKIIFLVIGGIFVAAWALFDWFTLFWAESLSLGVIAGHFLADSYEWFTQYTARGRKKPLGYGELEEEDGTWAFRIRAMNHEIVATDGGQGYRSMSSARKTLEKVMHGEYRGPIKEVE